MDDLTQTSFLVSKEESGLRLDKLLGLRFPDCSRTYFQSLIEQGHVRVNQIPCKKRYKPCEGEEISLYFALTPELSLLPENIPLDILYEDDDLLLVNKPAGMVVHPAPGHTSGTFVNALLFHCNSLEYEEGCLRPGIVHRLDKDTSGVLLAAKNSYTHRQLVALFSQRKLCKTYKAICLGHPVQTEIQAPIGRHPKKRQEMSVCPEKGKPALTKLSLVTTGETFSLLDVELVTGRTHQIRVHLQHIGCPILGDPVYGISSINSKWKVCRQMLHAEKLYFTHPRTGQEVQIVAPMPHDIQNAISKII